MLETVKKKEFCESDDKCEFGTSFDFFYITCFCSSLGDTTVAKGAIGNAATQVPGILCAGSQKHSLHRLGVP